VFLFAPAGLIAPVAGVYIDRFDRRRILLVTYGLIALLAGLLAGLTAADRMELWSTYGFALAMGTCFAVLGASVGAVIANTVPARDLASAISINSVIANLTRVAGPIVAAPLIAGALFEWGFGLYALATVVALLLVARVRVAPYQPDPDLSSLLARMADGLRHARERHPTVPALGAMATLSVFGVATTALLPSFSSQVLDQPDGRFAWLVAATGVGAIAGALVAGWDQRTPTLARATTYLVGYGIMSLTFGLNSSFVVGLGLQAVIGVFYFLTTTQVQTLVQLLVDESKRGRVMSLFQVSWAGLLPVGTLALSLVTGPVGLGVRAAFLTWATILTAIAALMTVRARLSGRSVSGRPGRR
jgi:MFS family permease